ncbi:hypothetical protein AA0229_0769 [Gluconobacter cerinus NRIC 0229]|nr:hypothetical protein AA0229_0769 [Gluconobacter cerinus NRIC 0229]
MAGWPGELNGGSGAWQLLGLKGRTSELNLGTIRAAHPHSDMIAKMNAVRQCAANRWRFLIIKTKRLAAEKGRDPIRANADQAGVTFLKRIVGCESFHNAAAGKLNARDVIRNIQNLPGQGIGFTKECRHSNV